MKKCWDYWGDNLLMDATFGCVKKGWSFYVILIIDGEGRSIVVAYFLIRDNSF